MRAKMDGKTSALDSPVPHWQARNRGMKREYYLKHRERILRKQSEAYHSDPELRRKKAEYDRAREQSDPLIGVYKGMLSRCYNKRNKSYYFYGGRGIEVCHEWRKSFTAFKAWALAHKWKRGLFLDRENVDGDYTPANCRFISILESNRNRRFVKLTPEKVVEIRRLLTEGMSQSRIAKLFNVSQSDISRIKLGKTWKT
jgi:Helix-turn-helix domain